MKLYLAQINQLLKHIANNQIKALLLYGPDKGYIDKICNTILKKFDLLQTSIEYNEITPSSLEILLYSQNFFSKKEFIKVRSVTTSMDKTLQIVLSKNFYHFIVFIADELPPSSTIRKFFEINSYLASIACYYDDEQKIANIIIDRCTKNNKTIHEEALTYLKSNLKGDHKLICSEIDKLIYFTFNKQYIQLTDVLNVISNNLITSSDDLCIHFAQKNWKNFLHELNKLKQNNINEVLIIRALIRFNLQIYIVLSKIEDGINIDSAIKSLSPPIFYKYVSDFKKIVSLSTIQDCINTLSCLQQAEIDYKLMPNSFDLYQKIYSHTNH